MNQSYSYQIISFLLAEICQHLHFPGFVCTFYPFTLTFNAVVDPRNKLLRVVSYASSAFSPLISKDVGSFDVLSLSPVSQTKSVLNM